MSCVNSHAIAARHVINTGGNGVLEGAEGIDCLFLAKPWVSVLRVARL